MAADLIAQHVGASLPHMQSIGAPARPTSRLSGTAGLSGAASSGERRAQPVLPRLALGAVVLSGRHAVRDLLATNMAGRVSLLSSFGPDQVSAALTDAEVGEAVLIVDGGVSADRPALIDAVNQARQRAIDVAVVLCHRDPVTVAVWVEAGASAVVTEDSPFDELFDLLVRITSGEQVIGVSIREGLLTHLREHRQRKSDRNAAFASLTPREAHVLRELCVGATPEEVAKSSYVSVNTIRSQIRGILAKLGLNTIVAAVALAYRSGWMGDQNQ
jgi:DNA-binding NarL/FixJ family response regulator